MRIFGYFQPKLIRMQPEVKAIIHQSELDFISKCVLDYENLETGGDLFGFWTKEGYPVVQYVIGPGKNTTRTAVSFYQDIDYLKKCGHILNSKFGLEHIGGWHSHHRLSLAHPSGGDVNTMRNAMRDLNLKNFLISISNINKDSSVSINAFLFSKGLPNDYLTCKWKVLEGISPIRECVNKLDSSLFISLENKKVSSHINTSAENTNSDKKKDVVEKPDLETDSYWSKPEGRKYLKEVYEKLSERKDLENVEILQLEDKRIAISFTQNKGIYEIRFPIDFPNNAPEVIEKAPRDGDGIIKKLFRNQKNRESVIQDFIHSLDIIEKNSVVTITFL